MIIKTSKRPLSSSVGEHIPLAALKDFVNNFKCEVRVDNTKNEDSLSSKFVVNGQVRKGEFFGVEVIEKLLTTAKAKKAAGFRIYLGLAYEDTRDEKHTQISSNKIDGWEQRVRFFITIVDEKGKDIEFDATSFKDTPDGDGAGLGNPHPPFGDN
ncbi:MAG: hypothetical protein MUF45_13380 [Spirosomaceae bacterium]|nr:hypothetical protein [Spirosomataceae bacterium]